MDALVLDIKTIKSDSSLGFTIQIVNQRLRGGMASFIASNGFYFTSLAGPALNDGYNTPGYTGGPMMYLRGSARKNDNDVLSTRSVGYVAKLKAAVIEYNIAKEEVNGND